MIISAYDFFLEYPMILKNTLKIYVENKSISIALLPHSNGLLVNHLKKKRFV